MAISTTYVIRIVAKGQDAYKLLTADQIKEIDIDALGVHLDSEFGIDGSISNFAQMAGVMIGALEAFGIAIGSVIPGIGWVIAAVALINAAVSYEQMRKIKEYIKIIEEGRDAAERITAEMAHSLATQILGRQMTTNMAQAMLSAGIPDYAVALWMKDPILFYKLTDFVVDPVWGQMYQLMDMISMHNAGFTREQIDAVYGVDVVDTGLYHQLPSMCSADLLTGRPRCYGHYITAVPWGVVEHMDYIYRELDGQHYIPLRSQYVIPATLWQVIVDTSQPDWQQNPPENEDWICSELGYCVPKDDGCIDFDCYVRIDIEKPCQDDGRGGCKLNPIGVTPRSEGSQPTGSGGEVPIIMDNNPKEIRDETIRLKNKESNGLMMAALGVGVFVIAVNYEGA